MSRAAGRMRAARYRAAGEIDVVTVPVPEPAPDQVLVEVGHCGICGTDLHDGIDGWAPPGTIGGHEWSGTVVARGTAVGDADATRVGARVVGPFVEPCGTCPHCRAHRPSLCIRRPSLGVDRSGGAFAEYVAVPASTLIALPDHLDLRAAALAEPLAVSLHAIDRSGVRAGQRATVFGAGPIGAGVLAGLRARGVDDVLVVEPAEPRAELARRLGAQACPPDALEVPALPGDLVDRAADAVFECSGVRAATEAGLAQTARGGALVLVGTGLDPPRLDPNRIILNEIVVTGALTYGPGGFSEAVALLTGGDVPVDTLVEPDDVGLDGLLDAMRRLRGGAVAGKVMVSP